jgi:hypothetical protein
MGFAEPQLPGVPFYRFVPGQGTSLLEDVQILNIQQAFGILPSVAGSTRVIDLQRAVNNADGSVTIFTTYKDGTSTISHYSQSRFEETLYGVDGGELGNVSYSAAGSGKASAIIRGQVGEVNFDNTNVTVLRGGQVTATGSGVNLLVMPNSTVQTTTFNSTLITVPGGTSNLVNLGSNNNLVLGLNTTVANLGNNNTIIGPVPPGSTNSGTGNTSVSPANLPLGTVLTLRSSTGVRASIDEDDQVSILDGGSDGGSFDNTSFGPGPDPLDEGGDGGGEGDPGLDPLINGHSFIISGDLEIMAGDGNHSIQGGLGKNVIVAGGGNNAIDAAVY